MTRLGVDVLGLVSDLAPRRGALAGREKKGSTAMRKARKSLFGVLTTLLLAAVAFAVPAGSAIAASKGSGSPIAAEAKKKCKKGFVRKKTTGGAGTAGWCEGRWAGLYGGGGGEVGVEGGGGGGYTGGVGSFF